MDTTRVALTELKDGVPHKVTVGETPIVLIRQGETVTALGGECPHAGAPLEEGVVCEGRLICPWHKAAFSVSDGSLVEPPALEGLARYAVRVEDGMAVVDGTTLPAGTPRADKTDGVIAIVGTGAAASGALALLMSRGHAGPVVLIGPEDGPPYDRTALSKMVVAGKMGPESKPVLPGELPPTVERVMGTVERIDPDARAIHLAGGRVVSYGQALVATGGTPKRPDLPGATLEGVHVLRGVADAKSLVEDLEGVKRVVVLGAGFIGLEAAAGLRAREIEVTVVDSIAVPLANVFGEAVGRRLRALHEEKGVVFRDGKIASFEGRARVERVRLEGGGTIDCDLVLLGGGIAPNVACLGTLASEDGVEVDGSLQVAPGLFAAGDIARFAYRGETVRIEHWRLAQQHGWLAARNMLGDGAVYDGVPYFWTAQHGKRIDYLGHASDWDEAVTIGDLEGLDFVTLLVKDGSVAAAVGCGRDPAMARLSEAMRRELSVAEARDLVA